MVQIALMITVGSALFAVESFIPIPFPFLRLGLANIITILVLNWWGLREALLVLILRVILGSLLSGKLLNPAFVLALSGGLAAVFAMRAAFVLNEKFFSFIGISLVGALFKNITQLLVVSFLFVKSILLLTLLPLFLMSTLVSGILVGMLAHFLDGKFSSLIVNRA
jgi:heptaprenyl diphosphate synthase